MPENTEPWQLAIGHDFTNTLHGDLFTARHAWRNEAENWLTDDPDWRCKWCDTPRTETTRDEVCHA